MYVRRMLARPRVPRVGVAKGVENEIVNACNYPLEIYLCLCFHTLCDYEFTRGPQASVQTRVSG
jgi:hypothetical protein